MKKGMIVIAMCVVLSFLVSMIAVAPLFAKPASQTTPTTKQAPQQGPAQAPVQQKELKNQGTPQSVYSSAHTKFWELEVDHCVLNGASVQQKESMQPPDNCCTVTVKVGQTATITCFYKVKTPTVSHISEADAKFWGTGKSYKVTHFPCGSLSFENENKTLPQFTWAEVQMWKQGSQGNAPKIWTEHMVFTLTPVQADANQAKCFIFGVDAANAINEPNEQNNTLMGWFKVTP